MWVWVKDFGNEFVPIITSTWAMSSKPSSIFNKALNLCLQLQVRILYSQSYPQAKFEVPSLTTSETPCPPNSTTEVTLLKTCQNKKGPKKIPGAPFWVSFSQLPAVEKTHQKMCIWKIFRPFLFCDDFSVAY